MFGWDTSDNSPNSKRCFWAALILAIIGFILVVVGVCLPFWVSETDVMHSGVFQLCGWSFADCLTTTDSDSSTIDVYWALAICGMFALLVAMVFLFTYPIRKTVDHCKIALGICVSMFLVIGVALILTLVILYIDDFREAGTASLADVFEVVGFAWYLTLVGLVFLVAAFVCFVLHMFFMVYE